MSLLPSSSDAEPDGDPRVVGVDSEEADEVLAALSSSTARELLQEAHDDPAPPSELADRVNTSVQNAQYHLGKLESAGAVEVIDTVYSTKGREMDVYAPADQPLVVFAGDQRDESTLRTALSRLLGAVGLLGIASLVVQAVVSDLFHREATVADSPDDDPAPPDDAEDDPEAAGVEVEEEEPAPPDDAEDEPEPAGDEVEEEEPEDAPEFEVDEDAADQASEGFELATEVVTTMPPGLLFFLGGLCVLIAVALVMWAR